MLLQTIALEPKHGQTLTFEFQPQEAGLHTHEARVCVRNNPFEDYCIALTGEGYQEDIAFEQLPNDSLEELRLPDAAISASVQAAFVLQNNSQKHFRLVGLLAVSTLDACSRVCGSNRACVSTSCGCDQVDVEGGGMERCCMVLNTQSSGSIRSSS